MGNVGSEPRPAALKADVLPQGQRGVHIGVMEHDKGRGSDRDKTDPHMADMVQQKE